MKPDSSASEGKKYLVFGFEASKTEKSLGVKGFCHLLQDDRKEILQVSRAALFYRLMGICWARRTYGCTVSNKREKIEYPHLIIEKD